MAASLTYEELHTSTRPQVGKIVNHGALIVNAPIPNKSRNDPEGNRVSG
jgi:hypothetical protein